MDMKTYSPAELHSLAEIFLKNWKERESLDWQEVEDLVTACKSLPEEILNRCLKIKGIIEHCDCEAEWDSGDIWTWPDQIQSELTQQLLVIKS
ncbi:hypothetical protein HUO09_17615 [Vibrio sp. Y2-5]|uniref:hypothetical protein n=1 Tax=Vibrio sp. Y2-5 TaxID=2743977 RepID=UPI0016617963|nr:hypothetical protein [Vibrio sp. Y2-5]MBD0788176.1 hypothetical protein [Vibrio sp. Y2-5]